MGCGNVNYKTNRNEERKIALRPYPDDINGINDKVANSFNAFLKTHGANVRPVTKERPKLNFDFKESKSQKRPSGILQTSTSADPDSLIPNELNPNDFNPKEFFLSSISEKKSAEESYAKNEEKIFILSMPLEGKSADNDKEVYERRSMRFSIKVVEDDSNEAELSSEAEKNIDKYT